MARMRLSWRLTGLILALLLPAAAGAYEFVPTELEFAAWPEYCKARYVTTYIGKDASLAPDFPQETIELWRQKLGRETFERVHHYCAGLTWLSRARLEPDAHKKSFYLSNANEEANFTLRGLPPESPLIAPILVTLAFTDEEGGNYDSAIERLRKAIKERPQEGSAYCAMAVVQRHRKRLDLARDILLEGDKQLSGGSAEIHYDLGLIYLELGDIEAATGQAERAYGMGYPLPGLKNKLERLRHGNG